MKKKLKLLSIIVLLLFFIIITIPIFIQLSMNKYMTSDINKLPDTYTALVPGALVYRSGNPSPVLKDRLSSALKLYKNGKVKRILVSGDHGTKYYDEVNGMKNYLLKNGVDSSDIFLDHAGFNTYNSIIRAKKIFNVNNMIITTQKYHLPRSLFIARKKKIKAYGYIADQRRYPLIKHYKRREFLARIKSYFEVRLFIKPKFLGKKIPITGDNKRSWD